jgi:hypothetical protein
VASYRPRQARADGKATQAAAGFELARALHAATESLDQEGQQRAR